MIRSAVALLAAATAAGLGLLVTPVVSEGAPFVDPVATPTPTPTASVPEPVDPVPAALPLAGARIALDPGHQLGNDNFPARINALVPAGGFTKPCNTTGTSTNGGYPEASLTFAVARSVQVRLEALGATVRMTRTKNSEKLWGPCVDARGRFGEAVDADLTVSLHADGAPAAGRGFHVIAPTSRSPWTTDIAVESRRLALALRAGFDATGIRRSTYVNNGFGLTTRADLGTLNLSDVPVAMIEVGNMRNAGDARVMGSYSGRARYADAVVSGIRTYLGR